MRVKPVIISSLIILTVALILYNLGLSIVGGPNIRDISKSEQITRQLNPSTQQVSNYTTKDGVLSLVLSDEWEGQVIQNGGTLEGFGEYIEGLQLRNKQNNDLVVQFIVLDVNRQADLFQFLDCENTNIPCDQITINNNTFWQLDVPLSQQISRLMFYRSRERAYVFMYGVSYGESQLSEIFDTIQIDD